MEILSHKKLIGHHYYDAGQSISWSDTFTDEEEDIRKKINTIEIVADWLFNKLCQAIIVLWEMAVGFLHHDDGKSFDKGIEILDNEFMLSQIVSPFSMKTIWKFKDVFVI